MGDILIQLFKGWANLRDNYLKGKNTFQLILILGIQEFRFVRITLHFYTD